MSKNTQLRDVDITIHWDCPICEYPDNIDDFLASDEAICINCGQTFSFADLAPDDQVEELSEAEIHINNIIPLLRNYKD